MLLHCVRSHNDNLYNIMDNGEMLAESHLSHSLIPPTDGTKPLMNNIRLLFGQHTRQQWRRQWWQRWSTRNSQLYFIHAWKIARRLYLNLQSMPCPNLLRFRFNVLLLPLNVYVVDKHFVILSVFWLYKIIFSLSPIYSRIKVICVISAPAA